MLRLADAEILPFEFTSFANTIDVYIDEIAKLLAASKPTTTIEFHPLRAAADKLRSNAAAYDRVLRASVLSGKRIEDVKALNRLLYQSERKLISEAGLPRREWFKHQIYAPGFYTGYGVKTLPGVREALEQKNWSEAASQVIVISKALDAMSAQIEAATNKLQMK